MPSVLGRIGWTLDRDRDGHRNYTVRFRVKGDVDDGPLTILNTPGLPQVGAYWNYGNDADSSAFCSPEAKVKYQSSEPDNEPARYWVVEQVFTTKPIRRCQSLPVEDPLLEPYRISGSFLKFRKEATKDFEGELLKNSSHELYRGSLVEITKGHPIIEIEISLPALPLFDISQAMDHVNDSAMWGLEARQIKLSNCTWQRHYYQQCTFYFTVSYEFEVDYDKFVLDVPDEGTLVLADGGDPDNPRDFIPYRNKITGDLSRVILDGAGKAWDGLTPPLGGRKTFHVYPEANILLLGVPAAFD